MLEKGQIVRSLKGNDKHRYYVVVNGTDDRVFIADGKIHKLEHPKAKNPKHLSVTHSSVNLEDITSNRWLRKTLEPMNQSLKLGMQHKGGN